MMNFIVRHFMLKLYLKNSVIVDVIGVVLKFHSDTVN